MVNMAETQWGNIKTAGYKQLKEQLYCELLYGGLYLVVMTALTETFLNLLLCK